MKESQLYMLLSVLLVIAYEITEAQSFRFLGLLCATFFFVHIYLEYKENQRKEQKK